jgi:uncharacterized membrane protein YjgN (DUF898 family)
MLETEQTIFNKDPFAKKSELDLGSRELKLSFSGTSGEYFSIWLTNMTLNIITLGIYSPWAKVQCH